MNDVASHSPARGVACRREDVINLYNLLLRRDPESDDVINPRVGVPATELFAGILGSQEFASRVVSPPAAKSSAVPAYRGSGRFSDLLDWAIGWLPLGAETRDRLEEACDWEDVDIALVRDPAVIGLVPALQEPKTQRAIELRYLRRASGLNVDTVFVSPEGLCFVSGWMANATSDPVREISVYREAELLGTTSNVARCRRTEAEKETPGAEPVLSGFWALVPLGRPIAADTKLEVSVSAGKERWCMADGVVAVSAERLRDIALEHLANARYFGNPDVEAFFELDNGAGGQLIEMNAGIVARIVEGGCRLRFGARSSSYDGSIIVCLFGKPEFLMLQAAFFSECPGYGRYEFIYVSNSPELGERLAAEAAIASRIYGVALTLIILPGNAGFGAANNAAAAAAETNRLLFVNPDVLPRDQQWPRRHTEMVRDLPAEQTRLFGSTLYYDDGSLMHCGMYIDVDSGFSFRDGKTIRRDMLRVEHYGKGAPPGAEACRASRAVPAVTGAVMSFNRAWFEELGGFSPKFIFGYYEDADLCLRSLQAGTPAWVHDLAFWHLESKGSAQAAAHVGGRLVNRWLMTSDWDELVRNELNGRNPARFAGPQRSKAPGWRSAGSRHRRADAR
jgi:GT2 family glycosyltransferase